MRVNIAALGGRLELAERSEYKRKDGTTGSLAKFKIAVKRARTEGEDLFTGVAFGKQADFLLEQCAQGDPVVVQGSLEVREWRDKQDARHVEWRINADSIDGAWKVKRQAEEARSSRETSGDGYTGYQESGGTSYVTDDGTGYVTDDPFAD